MRVCECAHVSLCVRVRASVGEHACALQWAFSRTCGCACGRAGVRAGVRVYVYPNCTGL